MLRIRRWATRTLPLGALLVAAAPAIAQETAKPAPATPDKTAQVDLLDGLKSGQIAAEAKGIGDGRVTLSITNRTRQPLRVVLPTRLAASGTTGQFGMGGMGGMGGGGMGGMGGMGGGMGGMGGGMGGMGGMGGGMGGMGGGMGGMGGMGGGMGGMGGGGMMNNIMGVAEIIMMLTGERDSWDWTTLMMGMGGMMGGMGGMGGGMGGMGGMGGGMMGGMGGMGGGMMGGMGGGMRSVPPTGPASALLEPSQTRHLPTRTVSLAGPLANGQPAVPRKDEVLRLSAISDLTNNRDLSAVVERLAAEKAPETVSQLVLWRLIGGTDWRTIDMLSNRWANAHEMALARQFVARVEQSGGLPEGEAGTIYVEVSTKAEAYRALAAELKTLIEKVGILGLKARLDVPARPSGPALACRITIQDSGLADVQLATSDVKGPAWSSAGKFAVPVTKDLPTVKDKPELSIDEQTQFRAALLADGVADGALTRLVRTQLQKGPKVHGKDTYKIRIDNVSPLVLNGLSLSGQVTGPESRLSTLAGFSLPPRKSFTLPASAELVERLGLKDGVKPVLADLSAL